MILDSGAKSTIDLIKYVSGLIITKMATGKQEQYLLEVQSQSYLSTFKWNSYK